MSWALPSVQTTKCLPAEVWTKTVRLWDVNTGRLLRILTGHTDDVMSVAFSPDGETLVSASWDGTIRLWNPRNGKLKRTLTEHASGISSVAFSPDGETLASGKCRSGRSGCGILQHGTLKEPSQDTQMLLMSWHFLRTGLCLPAEVGTQPYAYGIQTQENTSKSSQDTRVMFYVWCFSPDGTTLASGSQGETVRLWNPNTGETKRIFANQTGWINPVVFSPDGASLLIGGHGISIWDTETSQYKKPLTGDIGNAISVVFSLDRRMVACGSADNKVHLWEYHRFWLRDTLYHDKWHG